MLVTAALMSALLYKLGNYEGRPLVVPSEAVPIWRNENLSIGGKLLEYIVPVISNHASMAKCPLSFPNKECMKPGRDWIVALDKAFWRKLNETHSETVLEIPRPKQRAAPLEIILVAPKKLKTFKEKRDAPIILFMHSGAFVAGIARTLLMVGLVHLLPQNVIWASVEYRLAPEHPYPAAPEDCLLALENLLKVQKMGKNGVHVAGVSSGGTLAATTALWGMQRGLQVDSIVLDSPVFPTSNPPQGFVLDSPSYRRMAFSRGLPDQWMRWAMGAYMGCQPEGLLIIPDQEPNNALPHCKDYHLDITGGAMSVQAWKNAAKKTPKKNLPSLIVLTGRGDPLHDGGEAFIDVYNQSTSTQTGDRSRLHHVDASSPHAGVFFYDKVAAQRYVSIFSEIILNTTRAC